MSYCVNCGVELEKSISKCPLCDTPVINPNQKKEPKEKPVYPERLDIPSSLSKKYIAFIISLVMLVPTLVLFVVSIVVGMGVIKYFIGAIALAWLWFVFPFLWKKPIPVLFLGIDAIALLSYLNMYNVDNSKWVTDIALPCVVVLWAICNIFIFWKRKPRSKLSVAIAILIAMNVMSFVVEISVCMFLYETLHIIGSLIVTACLVSLVILFAYLDKSKRMKAWISRKFFV